ncbi:MAG: hypothetical protein ACRDJI_01665 [Actinomycetota bacterium]
MTEINVRRKRENGDSFTFTVDIAQSGSTSVHDVTLQAADFERLARPSESKEAFIERCFEFLLAREPKESILAAFDVAVISQYFPEFESEI